MKNICVIFLLVQEEGIIRNMLALEEARTDFEQGEMRRKSNSSSPETVAISDSEKSTTPKANSPDLSEALEIVEKPKVATVSPLIATIAANQKKPSKAFAPTLAFLSDTKSTVLEIIENQASNPRKAPVNYPTKQENEAQQRYAKSVPNVKPYVYVPPAKLVQTPKATVVPGKDRPLPVGSAYTAKEATGKTPSHILKGATYYTGDQKNPEVNKPAFTAADFPISLDGICPYCKSADVVYVILQDDDMDDDLPDLLARLEKAGKALKMKKGLLCSIARFFFFFTLIMLFVLTVNIILFDFLGAGIPKMINRRTLTLLCTLRCIILSPVCSSVVEVCTGTIGPRCIFPRIL